MTNISQFQGFFSYAHHDGTTDPKIVEAFSRDLEQRVGSKIVNAEFKIWRDKSRLRTGDKWNEKITSELNSSQILIVMMSPRWLTSANCRKEYIIFSEAESKLEFGQYIIPLIIHSCEGQKSHFTEDQSKIYREICERQYIQTLAEEFLSYAKSKRIKIIDKIADDIVGMIERLRSTENINSEIVGLETLPPIRQKLEYDARAHNFEEVSFVTEAEVCVGNLNKDNRREIFAFADFIERLYIQTTNARIEFGIRRALLRIEDKGSNDLSGIEEFSSYTRSKRGNAYYVNHLKYPKAITVCIDPTPGSFTLRELPLPPAPGENRLAKVATVIEEARIEELSAKLNVSLCPEGLFIFAGENSDKPSPATARKIAAIVSTLASKKIISDDVKVERDVPVKKRRS